MTENVTAPAWLWGPGPSDASSPPQTPSTPGSGALTPEAARAELEQLRVARIEGKVTQDVYLERADYLARLAAGEQNLAPPQEKLEYLPPDQQAERLWLESLQPAQPHEYPLPGLDESDPEYAEDLAVDTAVREMMSGIGVPAQWGLTFAETMGGLIDRFENAAPEEIRAYTTSVGEQLRAHWGEQYGKRLEAVSDLLAQAAEKHEFLGYILDKAPHAFADVRLMDWLAQIAERRAKVGEQRR